MGALRIAFMVGSWLFAWIVVGLVIAFGYYLYGLDFNERCPKLAECYGMSVFWGFIVGFGAFVAAGCITEPK